MFFSCFIPVFTSDDVAPGDVVRLRCGGPRMVVERVRKGSPSTVPDDMIDCVYLDSGKVSRNTFVPTSLTVLR